MKLAQAVDEQVVEDLTEDEWLLVTEASGVLLLAREMSHLLDT